MTDSAKLAMDIAYIFPGSDEDRIKVRGVIEVALKDFGNQSAREALRTFAKATEARADAIYEKNVTRLLQSPGRNEAMVRAGDLYMVADAMLTAAGV